MMMKIDQRIVTLTLRIICIWAYLRHLWLVTVSAARTSRLQLGCAVAHAVSPSHRRMSNVVV